MKKQTIRKACVFALSAIMALSMSATVFAAGTSGAYNSDNTDYNENGTGNSTATRQASAGTTKWSQNGGTEVAIGEDGGVITLGKILTVNQQNKFPNVEDFVYKVTPISAWDNANVSTAKSGATIAKSDMPKPTGGPTAAPAATGTTNHLVANYGTGNDWYTYVSIGNFKDGTQNNTSTVTNSDAASNTDLVNDNYRRTRTTDLKFQFTKAGYYMYKIEEVGSIANGTSINNSNPAQIELKKDVAGVDYDNNTYYVVFYVTNKQATANSSDMDEYGHGTQKGDTQTGVYVNNITSWTNSQSTDNKAADLQDSDALKSAKDLMETMDNGGEAAKPNTGRVDGNNTGVNGGAVAGSNGTNNPAATNNPGVSSVTHDNLGKVGVTPPPSPNKLEAYRMWNAQTSHDIVLKKNVTGNLGDRTKVFEFTVTLSGLENTTTYTTNVVAGSTDSTTSSTNVTNTGDQTSSGVTLRDATAGTIAQDGKSFTSSATGTAVFKVNLKDDEMLVINALPRSASYQIEEAASDHVPQYDIVSTNKATTGDMAVIKKAEDKSLNATNSNQTLATDVEFVDRYDGTVVIIYQNNRDLATVTGVVGLDYMVYAVILLLLMGSAYAIIKRRREYADEMCD